MKLLGEDFTGGFFRRIYAPSNPAGLWYAMAVAVGLFVVHQLLQLAIVFVYMLIFKINPGVTRETTKVALVSIFPASLVVGALALWLAGRRGGSPSLSFAL